MRGVHHVERVVVPDEPEHGRQVVAEHGLTDRSSLVVEDDIEDTVELLGRRAAHVHRVFADKEIAAVVTGDHRGMFDVGNFANQFSAKAVGDCLSRRYSWGSRSEGQDCQCDKRIPDEQTRKGAQRPCSEVSWERQTGAGEWGGVGLRVLHRNPLRQAWQNGGVERIRAVQRWGW